MKSIYERLNNIDDEESLIDSCSHRLKIYDNSLQESYNEDIIPVLHYISDKYKDNNVMIEHVHYTAVRLTFFDGVKMTPWEPYDDEFFLEFQSDLTLKFQGSYEFDFELIDEDSILVDISLVDAE